MSETTVIDPATNEEVKVIDVNLFALNLDESDGRVLSATEDQYGAPGQPRVETLPEVDLYDYRYANNEFIYDPLPKPDPPEPPAPAGEYATYDDLAAAIKEGVNSYGQ